MAWRGRRVANIHLTIPHSHLGVVAVVVPRVPLQDHFVLCDRQHAFTWTRAIGAGVDCWDRCSKCVRQQQYMQVNFVKSWQTHLPWALRPWLHGRRCRRKVASPGAGRASVTPTVLAKKKKNEWRQTLRGDETLFYLKVYSISICLHLLSSNVLAIHLEHTLYAPIGACRAARQDSTHRSSRCKLCLPWNIAPTARRAVCIHVTNDYANNLDNDLLESAFSTSGAI